MLTHNIWVIHTVWTVTHRGTWIRPSMYYRLISEYVCHTSYFSFDKWTKILSLEIIIFEIFSASPTAQISPELHFCFKISFTHPSRVWSHTTTPAKKNKQGKLEGNPIQPIFTQVKLNCLCYLAGKSLWAPRIFFLVNVLFIFFFIFTCETIVLFALQFVCLFFWPRWCGGALSIIKLE